MDSLQEAINKRDEFLKNHPHLREKQDEIDSVLDKCRDCDRMAVVNMLMIESMIELQKYLNTLKGILPNDNTVVQETTIKTDTD